jgi:diguanylate cyclase (GGDEF)-like protein
MSKKLHCWEALSCGKKKCPAYENKNYNCWLIPDTLCHDNNAGGLVSKTKLCLNCKVFINNINPSSLKTTLRILSLELAEYENRLKKQKRDNLPASQVKMPDKTEKTLPCSDRTIKNAGHVSKFFIENLQDIIELMPDPTFAIDNDKKVMAWNMAIEKMAGVKKADIIGKGDYAYAVPFYGYKRPVLIDLLNATDQNVEKTYTNIKRELNSISGEIILPSFIKGSDIHIWAIASPIYSRDGTKLGAIQSIRDITELKESEKMVLDINNQLRDWANNLEKTTKDLGTLNTFTKLMQSCANIDEAYDIVSHSMMELFPAFSGCIYMHNNKTNLFDIATKWGDCQIEENSFKSSNCWALRLNRIYFSKTRSGHSCKLLPRDFSGGYICLPLVAQGKSIGLLHLQVIKESLPSLELEITDARQQFLIILGENISLSLYSIQLRETLRFQAIRDPLTELFNRRYMEESLKREIQRARRRKSPIGLIMFDIDQFKRFNDTYGHKAGDTMLREIASFVKSNIRAEDIASRYGGEEFLITMPDATVQITQERAEKLRQEVKKLHVMHSGQYLGAVTMSFGVAAFPNHAQDWEPLIKAADDALYRAKAEGRDRVVVAG